TSLHDGAVVNLTGGSFCGDNSFIVPALTQFNLCLLFARVNNSFVEQFQIGCSQPADTRFLEYLKKNAAALNCRIKYLSIPTYSDPRGNIDHALIDFVASHLRPQTLLAGIYDVQQTAYAMPFDQKSMRSVLQHARPRIR
ncbi:hypothetical protein AAVH_20225, partial [Aphelenchoides avenae]